MKTSITSLNKKMRLLEEKRAAKKAKIAHEAAVSELELWFSEKQSVFNSPEMKAQRQQEYEELILIGEQRRLALLRGEGFDKYPLPWEG